MLFARITGVASVRAGDVEVRVHVGSSVGGDFIDDPALDVDGTEVRIRDDPSSAEASWSLGPSTFDVVVLDADVAEAIAAALDGRVVEAGPAPAWDVAASYPDGAVVYSGGEASPAALTQLALWGIHGEDGPPPLGMTFESPLLLGSARVDERGSFAVGVDDAVVEAGVDLAALASGAVTVAGVEGPFVVPTGCADEPAAQPVEVASATVVERGSGFSVHVDLSGPVEPGRDAHALELRVGPVVRLVAALEEPGRMPDGGVTVDAVMSRAEAERLVAVLGPG